MAKRKKTKGQKTKVRLLSRSTGDTSRAGPVYFPGARVTLVELGPFTLPEHPFVIYSFFIGLSFLLRFTAFYYTFRIFKDFFQLSISSKSIICHKYSHIHNTIISVLRSCNYFFIFYHFFVCSSSIYGFWIALWYLQIFKTFFLIEYSFKKYQLSRI
jgi:hypothetical protein